MLGGAIGMVVGKTMEWTSAEGTIPVINVILGFRFLFHGVGSALLVCVM
jgi:hypothetical protein